MMSLDQVEAEFVQLCKEISKLEKCLGVARKRAEKLAHYIEIAREDEGQAQAHAGESRPDDQSIGADEQPVVVSLPRRRRRKT